MSFLHAALRFRVWVGRSGKIVGASMRLEEDVRLVWNGMNRENALDYKASMFLYIPFDTSGIGFSGSRQGCHHSQRLLCQGVQVLYKGRRLRV